MREEIKPEHGAAAEMVMLPGTSNMMKSLEK